jgi:glycerophosphoryl diester phosphodiesterase
MRTRPIGTLVAAALAAATVTALVPPVQARPSAASAAASASLSAAGRSTTVRPTLVARATLSADHLEPGPPSGAEATPANGRTGPFSGQVIPGFSAMVDNRDGSYWAMPDNGFGSKTNSEDFLLRIYRVRPRWETATGGKGQIAVGRHISLRDPDRHIDFPIVNGDTRERLLTGADFDIESLVRAKDGSFWVGEEFGPFLLHVSASGKLLEAPVPFPDGKSPANPSLQPGEQPRVGSSRGFEAMGRSKDGRHLYPVVEGAFTDDADQRRRWIYEFDTRKGAYTGRTWAYQTDQVANVIGDAFVTGRDRMLLIERDDFEGPKSVTKRVYEVDFATKDAEGYVEKELVLDALAIHNPDLIGADTGYATAEQWALPVQSFETVLLLPGNRLLIGNDNNYPGNSARNSGTPDDTEMAVVELRKVRTKPSETTVVAHRGASGHRPEHTLAAYQQALVQCADYIEPDLVATKDGVLVARHENEIGSTTDVSKRTEFASRRTTKTIDGTKVTGWFTEDFTLAELRTLRAVERLPKARPGNTAFDGLYQVPTFDEVLDLARHSRTCEGRPVGVYPETKHPTYFDSVGLSLEEPLLAELQRNEMADRSSPVIIQSFETGNLKELSRRTGVTIAQLVNCSGAPYDLVAAGDDRTYRGLVTRQGLREIAKYADSVGLCKDVMIPRNADGTLGQPTSVIKDAHRGGLEVHGWTFRAENQFLPVDFRSSTDPNARGDMAGELRVFLDAGMDGFFTDHPDLGAAVTG